MEKLVIIAGQSHSSWEIATFTVTALGVVVLICYTWFTYRQNQLTKKALELGRRAWIVIRGTPDFEGDLGWTFENVTVENIADMPAVIQKYGTGSVESDLDSLAPDKWIRSGGVVVRGDRVSCNFPDVGPPQRDPSNILEHLAAIKTTDVYCIIKYTDCFEKTWTTIGRWRAVEEIDPAGGWRFVPGYPKMK